MKKLLFIIISFSVLSTGLLQAQNSGEFSIPLTDPAKRGKLKAHINYGSITVKGTARKDVLVKYSSEDDDDSSEDKKERERDRERDRDVDVRVNGNTNTKKDQASSRDGLKKISGSTLDLEASETSNSVRVTSDSWSTKINLDIEVPSGFDVQVHTYNDGDLLITNIQGIVELDNFNGDITAQNISGSVVATTYNGEIKVSFDKITDASPMSFSTFNGDIDLTFPAALKASFKMKTERGEILSGFDMVMSKTSPVQKKETQSGTYKVVIDEWVRGDIGGGGPEFSLKTYNGDILVKKK